MLLVRQIDPTLANSFLLRLQEQVRWFQRHLVMLSSDSDSFVSDQQAIAGAMIELRQLMRVVELVTNERQDENVGKLVRRMQREPDANKTIESAQQLQNNYALGTPQVVNELRNELTVIIGQCDMLKVCGFQCS